MRLENNIELFFDAEKKEATFIKRGTGDVVKFICDEKGEKFISYISKNEKLIIGDELLEIANELKSCGLITERSECEDLHNNKNQYQYLRDLNLNPIEAENILSKVKIGVVGVGGVGSWIVMELAAVGVKKFTLIDTDIVNVTNLGGQIFPREYIGIKKTIALKREINRKYNDIEFSIKDDFISGEDQLDKYLMDCDYVLVAADEPSRTSMGSLIGRWCLKKMKVHFICGGYASHLSSLGLTIIPGKTPCWDCFIESRKLQTQAIMGNSLLVSKGLKVGTGIMPFTAIAASFTVLEILKVVLGTAGNFEGQHFDFLFNEFTLNKESFSFNPNCKYCAHIQGKFE